MEYKKIDLQTWGRQEHYHFFRQTQHSFGLTVDIDISNIIRVKQSKKYAFYPLMLHLITCTINQFSEFKMSFYNSELIEWKEVLPLYTVFNDQTQTFALLWTEYEDSTLKFMQMCSTDILKYKNHTGLVSKPNVPANHFTLSNIPWVSFNSFNISMPRAIDYFAPILTMGKFYEKEGKTFLPLAIQVHHAVCDGFTISMFFESLQNLCSTFKAPSNHEEKNSY